MKLFKSMALLSVVSMLFLFSCSNSNTTEPEPDPLTEIPDDASPIPNAQAAAELATATLNGVGDFVAGALDPFYSTKKPTNVSADSLYYKDGWWYYIASVYYNDGESGNDFGMELDNKYQFSKNGSVHQSWATADKVHAIVDVAGSYSTQGMTMDIKYYFDVTFSNINSSGDMILPIIVDGAGYYDFIITTTEEGKQRYYLTYRFDNFKVPENDYPMGTLKIGTKNYKINMIFDGTNMVTVDVMQNGKTVYSMQYNLDNENS